jgi:hypothetical protein
LVIVERKAQLYGIPDGEFALARSDEGRGGALAYRDNLKGAKGL